MIISQMNRKNMANLRRLILISRKKKKFKRLIGATLRSLNLYPDKVTKRRLKRMP